MSKQDTPKTAKLYRMVMDKHICPFGLKARHLLQSHGFTVDDHHLSTREETEAFKTQHDVKTTPQIFIGGERIGGYEDLRRHLGLKIQDPDAVSYQPVLAVFAIAAGLALAVSWMVFGSPLTVRAAEWFVAFSMAILAMLKLQDVNKFATMFLGYDLLARRWVPYARIYPFAEATAGILMAGHLLPWLSIPLALFIGTVGAISVYYAVYVQKRELKCACVGGSGRVPLGFVSLTENLFMIAMALWMLFAPY
ncbi:glutaredoxin [Croceicoccus sediminis]|uniref:glutaredoxin n=1 Tax=Croceicoccus sediminis TaxID=2571150 RepID=UPI001F0EE800|nr:glutaredoxin [Croceicoccus sediminis]